MGPRAVVPNALVPRPEPSVPNFVAALLLFALLLLLATEPNSLLARMAETGSQSAVTYSLTAARARLGACPYCKLLQLVDCRKAQVSISKCLLANVAQVTSGNGWEGLQLDSFSKELSPGFRRMSTCY